MHLVIHGAASVRIAAIIAQLAADSAMNMILIAKKLCTKVETTLAA
jgi:hypothetical protein